MSLKLPPYQERFHVYVLGPNQDSRLASVAGGANLKGVDLLLDPDAPFQLRARAVRQQYTSTLTQAGLQFLSMRYTGAGGTDDYLQQSHVSVAADMPYFGQAGMPRSINPQPIYGASQAIRVDLINNGSNPITNLTLYFFGVKLFPWGAVQNFTYPQKPRQFSSESYHFQAPVTALGVSELRQNVFVTIDQNDMVILGGQATAPFLISGNRQFSEVFITLKDEQRKPYSNDFVPLDILFGSGGFPAAIPFNKSATLISPFGAGPANPGLIYPELYLPNQHQLYFDLLRTDGASQVSNQSENFVIDFIGKQVRPQ